MLKFSFLKKLHCSVEKGQSFLFPGVAGFPLKLTTFASEKSENISEVGNGFDYFVFYVVFFDVI